MERYNFSLVPCERKDLLTGLDIPQFSCVVHGAGCHEHAVGVKRETNDFHFMAFKSVVALTSVCVPYLGFFIERARNNFVSEWIIEGHTVDHIGVLV